MMRPDAEAAIDGQRLDSRLLRNFGALLNHVFTRDARVAPDWHCLPVSGPHRRLWPESRYSHPPSSPRMS